MNKKSETLRQREKAQKDLLELKKMQRGDIDPSILKDDDKKITPKTPDEKIENFFFYHKYKLLFAAAVAVVLAIIITSAITTPKSIAGSVILSPPAILIYASQLEMDNPKRFSNTAINRFKRFKSLPAVWRLGKPKLVGDTNA